MDEPSDYTNSGFDKFLSRGDTPNLGGALDQPAPSNNALPADRTQITGQMGDILPIGNINLDGTSGAITIRDDNNLRVVMGLQADGSQGVIISKEGFDADINRPANLVLNSQQNNLKVAKSDTYTFPAIVGIPANTQPYRYATIPHNLGVVPGFLLYLKVINSASLAEQGFPASYYKQIFDSSFFAVNNITDSYYSGIDEKNLYLARSSFNGDGSNAHDAPEATVRFYILQESIST